MFRLSSDKTPIIFADGVSEEVKEQILSFFTRCDARDEKNKIRTASLLQMRNHRDEMCKLLGFSDWESYWVSPLWKKIRRKILKRDKKTCSRCEGAANQVHHRSYGLKVLEGKVEDQLVSLCDGCHHVVHHDDWGDKRSIDEWDAILLTKNLSDDFPALELNQDNKGRRRHPAWRKMSAIQRAKWKALYK